MALLTALSLEQARPLLSGYGLELLTLTPLSAGSVNSNFFLRARNPQGTAPGKPEETDYFARIYEEQGDAGAEFELRLNETLSAAGIPVARPLRLVDGSLFATFSGKPFAVYERLHGEVLCQQRVTESATRAVGEALARVHTADLGGLAVPESRFGFEQLDARLSLVREAGRPDLLEAVEFLAQLSGKLRGSRESDLPTGLIHGDLFRDNVLIVGEGVAESEHRLAGLLDFESASQGPYVYDLMVTLLAWCFSDGLEVSLARSMVQGYEQVRALTQKEKLSMTLEGSVACARFATTRLTDFSLRAPIGTAPKRDYRRFFQRLTALESGQLERALWG